MLKLALVHRAGAGDLPATKRLDYPAVSRLRLLYAMSLLARTTGYHCRVGPDAEMKAAVASAGLGIWASMLRAYAEKTGRSDVANPIVLHLELAVTRSLS